MATLLSVSSIWKLNFTLISIWTNCWPWISWSRSCCCCWWRCSVRLRIRMNKRWYFDSHLSGHFSILLLLIQQSSINRQQQWASVELDRSSSPRLLLLFLFSNHSSKQLATSAWLNHIRQYGHSVVQWLWVIGLFGGAVTTPAWASKSKLVRIDYYLGDVGVGKNS